MSVRIFNRLYSQASARRRSAGRPVAALKSLVPEVEVKLRPPVTPTVENITVKEDHPLWQFFPQNRKYLRSTEDLKEAGEPWTIPQLRLKSFEDLHTLWWVCIKERNRLGRESRIYETLGDAFGNGTDNPFEDVDSKIKTTLWRIRFVLGERRASYLNAKETYKHGFGEIYNEFKDRYLSADAGMDSEMEIQLERFQYSFYGINPELDENVAEPLVVRGLKVVSNLKLARYGSALTPEAEIEGEENAPRPLERVRDVNEAFIVFNAPHTPEGIADALETIKEYREQNPRPIQPSKEVPSLAVLLKNFRKERDQPESVVA